MKGDGSMTLFLWGTLATTTWVIGLVFFRYWAETKDRFFAFFGAAFWVFCANWVALAVINPTDETRHYVYLIRLVAFVLILVAIIDKNRARAARED
jgi:hypothetical protein